MTGASAPPATLEGAFPDTVNPWTRAILSLRPRSLWTFFARQDFVYWGACVYLLIEYVRPQQLIGPLNSVPVGQIVLGASLLAHVGSGKWFQVRGLVSWLLLLFTAVIVASSVAAYLPEVAADQLRLWFSWVIIFFLITSVVNNEERFAFFIFLWLLFNFYMAQGAAKQFALRGFTFTQWGVVGAPGWFSNSGEFGIAMCMFVPVAWHYYQASLPYVSKWYKLAVLAMPVTAIVGIVGSSSRGAVLGLAAVGGWTLLSGKRRVRRALGVAALGGGVWLLLPPEQKARFTTAGDDITSQTRMTYWRNGLDMAANHPVLGIGYGNWLPYYHTHYRDASAPSWDPRARVQLAHNIFIQCMAELGYVGLAVFVMLILGTLKMNHETRKIARAARAPPHDFVTHMAHALDAAMIGFLASGFFVTVLYYPFFWINLAFTAALAVIARRKYRNHGAGRSALSFETVGTDPYGAR